MAVPALRGFLAALLLAAAGAAYADDRLWILTGEGYRDNYYFGGGLVIPFPRNHLGQGWVQRYWLDAFTYTYEAGPQEIDSSVWGAEVMIGYQASDSRRWGALYGGVRYSNAHLSPDDPGAALRGQQLFPKVQAEGEAPLSKKWRASGIAAYLFVLDGYWTRLRVVHALAGTRFVGPEVVAQGDPDYSALKLGIVYGGIALSPSVLLNVKGGYRWQSGADSPYIGAELVGTF